ncbi:MAG: type II toxin-antitoxin system prevent-host-death family antitoxin [Planctomycetales bacterium]|nr:type II toxin-antitoxin system prevent-host-death family antitoxin [Planctomycetales bacterium]
MSENVVSLEHAISHLEEVVERVCANGEVAVVTKSGLPLVRIVPAAPSSATSEELIDFLKRWRTENLDADDTFAGSS